MVEGVENVGEAVTGGMVARTIEPRAGEPAGHGQACLNCGTGLVGDYCHRCGQKGHVHRTLGAIWHDISHSVLHFEGKMWRTLPLLAWRPGELTRRYVAGERARFVSPMALFLFSVFLMFAVFSLLGGPLDFTRAPQEARLGVQNERRQLEAKIAALERERDAARAAGQDVAAIGQRIADARLDLAGLNIAGAVAGPGDPETGLSTKTNWKPLDDAIAKAEANPALLFYKVQANAYKFSWALIPLSVPFLWLLFLHRPRYWRYRAYDHTVFVTYSIAFMSLAGIALSLLQPLGVATAILGLALVLVPPIHMYRQLRGAYQLSRFSALWRTIVLLISSLIAASFFFVLLLGLGVLG
jgi:hypothetical protein